jgi:SAM-dependent methyltransferase
MSGRCYKCIYAAKNYEREAAEIASITRRLNPSTATLLDVACGTGRHLEHLRHQFQCRGLDAQSSILAVARARLADAVRLHVAYMTDYELPDRFDAITCMASSIGYTRTLGGLAAAAKCIATHLNPAGVVIIEPWLTPNAWLDPGLVSVEQFEDEDATLVRVDVSSRAGNASTVRSHYIEVTTDGISTADHVHVLGLFSRDEYLEAFGAAGIRASFDEAGGFMGRGLITGVKARGDSDTSHAVRDAPKSGLERHPNAPGIRGSERMTGPMVRRGSRPREELPPRAPGGPMRLASGRYGCPCVGVVWPPASQRATSRVVSHGPITPSDTPLRLRFRRG